MNAILFLFLVYLNRFNFNHFLFFLTQKESILSGRIKVNQKIVDLEYKLKANDLIIHEAIRKEPPVYDTPIEIIYEDDELLVINKPSSMPVSFN